MSNFSNLKTVKEYEDTFRFAVDYKTWKKLPFIIKLGNLAVHTEKNVAPGDALESLRGLFEFIQWVDYYYGSDYRERTFDEQAIPKEKVDVETENSKTGSTGGSHKLRAG